MTTLDAASIDRANAQAVPSRGPARRAKSAPDRTETFGDDRQAAGNLALQRSLRSGAIQAKLTIGEPGDFYEREADDVADRVMRSSAVPAIQRKCAACAGGAPCPKCEEEVQAKAQPGRRPRATRSLERDIVSIRGGEPLSRSARNFLEPCFGRDFSQVRVHTGTAAAESARAIQARAYTAGQDVVFAAGEYAPESGEGLRLLAHELTHVVQQHSDSDSSARVQRQEQEEAPNTSTSGQGEPNVCVAPPDPATLVCTQAPQPLQSPAPGHDAAMFWVGQYGQWQLSSDPDFVRYQLARVIAEHGVFGGQNFVAMFAQDWGVSRVQGVFGQFGNEPSPEFGRLVLGILREQLAVLETRYWTFGALIRNAAIVRLRRNHEALDQWRAYVDGLAPRAVQRDVVAEESRALLLTGARNDPVPGPISRKDLAEQWTHTSGPAMRGYLGRRVRGEIHSGCESCHEMRLAIDRDFSSGAHGEEWMPPAQRLPMLAAEDYGQPAGPPIIGGTEVAGHGIPDWAWGDIGDRPGLTAVASAVDQIRPNLYPLGDEGYRVVPSSVINSSLTPRGLVAAVDAAIEGRQRDYEKLIDKLGDYYFDFTQLTPILQELLPFADPEVQIMVRGVIEKAAAEREEAATATVVAGIAAFLLTIFPPTAPLGIALGAGLSIYGLASGYQDFQQGYTYSLGRGAGVFSPEQEEAATTLMVSGVVSMALSAADLVGTAVGTIRLARGAPGAAGELGAIERAEAEAAGAHVRIDDVSGTPHVTVTDAEGNVLVSGSIEDLEALLVGRAQSPRLAWRPNPGGQQRTVTDAVKLARSRGVVIPDDILFAAVPGKWQEGVFAEYAQILSQHAGKTLEDIVVTWDDFYNQFEKIPVRLNPQILSSDEAIVAVIGHEMYELNELRRLFEELGGEMSGRQLHDLIRPGVPKNLHDLAWDESDRLVTGMR